MKEKEQEKIINMKQWLLEKQGQLRLFGLIILIATILWPLPASCEKTVYRHISRDEEGTTHIEFYCTDIVVNENKNGARSFTHMLEKNKPYNKTEENIIDIIDVDLRNNNDQKNNKKNIPAYYRYNYKEDKKERLENQERRFYDKVTINISGCPTLQNSLDEQNEKQGRAVTEISGNGRTLKEICDSVGRGCDSCLLVPDKNIIPIGH